MDKPESRLLTKNRDFFDKCTTLFKRSTATGGLGSSGPTFPDIGGMNLSSGQGGQTSRPVLIDVDDTPTWSDGGMSSGSKRSYGAEGGSSRRKRGKNNDNLSKNEFVDCLDAVLAKNVEVMKPQYDQQKECYKLLVSMGVDARLLMKAMDQLCTSMKRNMFLMVTDDERRVWVEGLEDK